MCAFENVTNLWEDTKNRITIRLSINGQQHIQCSDLDFSQCWIGHGEKNLVTVNHSGISSITYTNEWITKTPKLLLHQHCRKITLLIWTSMVCQLLLFFLTFSTHPLVQFFDPQKWASTIYWGFSFQDKEPLTFWEKSCFLRSYSSVPGIWSLPLSSFPVITGAFSCVSRVYVGSSVHTM